MEMCRRCCSSALRFLFDIHVLLPEAGEDSDPPLAGEPMALGRVAGAAIDEEAGAAADTEAGAAIDAEAGAAADETGAAIDVDACTTLEVLTLKMCALEVEGEEEPLIVGMPAEDVIKDEVADTVAVAAFEVVEAEWEEAAAELEAAAEVAAAAVVAAAEVRAAEVVGRTVGADEVVGATVAAAEVAPAALVWPGTTIVPVAVGVPVVYTKMGESRAGVESAVNMTACFPSGCTGLFPGSFRRVPVAIDQRNILNSHWLTLGDLKLTLFIYSVCDVAVLALVHVKDTCIDTACRLTKIVEPLHVKEDQDI